MVIECKNDQHGVARDQLVPRRRVYKAERQILNEKVPQVFGLSPPGDFSHRRPIRHIFSQAMNVDRKSIGVYLPFPLLQTRQEPAACTVDGSNLVGGRPALPSPNGKEGEVGVVRSHPQSKTTNNPDCHYHTV